MGFFRGKMDFSRASFNEKNHRQQQSSHMVSNVPNRSVSTSSSYNQYPPLESNSSNIPHGFSKPSVLRTVNAMHKSNTSLDLDHEVGLVEQAVNNIHIMTDEDPRSSDRQFSVYQVPSSTTIGISNDRRTTHLGHNSAKMRDFTGSHGSIVDVLSSQQFGNRDLNNLEGSRGINQKQLRFVK